MTEKQAKPKTRTVTDEQGQVWECRDFGPNPYREKGFERLVECKPVPVTKLVGETLFPAPTDWEDPEVLGDEKLLEMIGGGL